MPETHFLEDLHYADFHEQWQTLTPAQRLEHFKQLPRAEAEEFFQELGAYDQAELLDLVPEKEQRLWLRALSPDDAADVIQEFDEEDRDRLLTLLDPSTRNEVTALLAYKADVAGGLMNPRYVRLRPDMTVAEALIYLRKQAVGRAETVYYLYILDGEQHLLGVVSLRRLLASEPEQTISEIMRHNVVTIREELDQEEIGRLFAQHNLLAIPVVDAEGCMRGIVTVDDIVDVVEEEATEDIQKMGGSAVLDAPYLNVSLLQMVGKRAGWLVVLFLGELLTTNAMGHYEEEIARAVVLALFVPLIISSGGNSGSQASTLVIRAMALGELKAGDWWNVFRREVMVGLALGAILGALGVLRVLAWPGAVNTYGEHYVLVGLTVGLSLIGVVLWGSLTGSLLPFLLRRAKLDPATASAPFVATLVDVTGLVIYFSVAQALLRGTLL